LEVVVPPVAFNTELLWEVSLLDDPAAAGTGKKNKDPMTRNATVTFL
jgi:hypothetical protein